MTADYVCVAATLLFVCSLIAPDAFAQQADSVAVDSLLIKEIESELSSGLTPSVATPPARPTQLPNSLNPAISVIGDFRASYVSEGDRNIDFEMHEVESAFKSVVDPYARADIYISIAQEDGEIEFELEEAFLTTLSLPARLQLKAGKFRSTFGKINRIHPHALPYIDIPAVYARFLGEEGLNDQGVSLSWLVPNESFFQELTLEVTRGPGESASFETSETNRLLYAGRLRNFWDLTSNSTLELGISGAVGPNDTGNSTYLAGLDLTYIWRPVRYNTYRSFMLQGEAIVSSRDEGESESLDATGAYLLGQYKFARRWLVTGRFDLSDLPDNADWNEQSLSITLGWLASEFQKIELGLKTTSGDDFDRFNQVLVRAVFVIGAHGAHEY